MFKYFLTIIFTSALVVPSAHAQEVPTPRLYSSAPTLIRSVEATEAPDISNFTRGHIVLQVEQHGEAWYIDPVETKRYYLRNGEAALRVLRDLGLGISEADFARLEAGNVALHSRLMGRIVLRVEKHGEAYYLSPRDKKLHYLADGNAAYQVMSNLGLGIKTDDLNAIPKPMTGAYGESPTFDEEYRNGVMPSKYREGITPSNVSVSLLTHYWAEKVNRVRRSLGEEQLSVHQSLIDTAAEWAAYIGKTETPTNDRPNDQVVHDWIGSRLLSRGEFYELHDRFFLEQIGWTTMEDSIQGGYEALDAIFERYLEDATSPGGYNPIHATAWDTIGSGFYFQRTHDDHIMIYMVTHLANFED